MVSSPSRPSRLSKCKATSIWPRWRSPISTRRSATGTMRAGCGRTRALAARFDRDFWIEEEGCYAMALEAGHRPCRVMSSNPGHALWAGIVDDDKAGRVVHRLMRPDLFNGWGIRTLSYKERRYNPM